MSIKRRKGNRRGFAGDDVTDNQAYAEEVVPQEDDSYVVKGTDSPDEIEVESETIDDQHNVVTDTDEGTEEEFLAESEEGDADVIDEDGESREGHRRGRRKGIRRGRRRGESDEDELEEDLEELEEDTEELKEDHEGHRRGRRKGIRRGSRKGETMDWDGIDYEAIAGKLEQLGEDPWGLDFDDLFDLAESKGLTPDQFEREGRKVSRRGVRLGEAVEVIMDEDGNTEDVDLPEPDEREGLRRGIRRGSRKGSVYGGRSPEHQESIRSAVSVAMKDRRL